MVDSSDADHSQTSKVPAEITALPYVCVHCNAPCAALYRRLSVSLSSIKAMTCDKCQKLVDPYIEQEWLLVAIDCILSREEAYRHVLNNVDELKTLTNFQLVQLLLGWSLLDGYLKWQTKKSGDNTGSLLHQDRLFELAPLASTSALGLLFQWYIMQLFHTQGRKKQGASLKFFWALLLPGSFSAVTVFVSIWENGQTVRMLSSILIAYWEGIAAWVIACDISTPLLGFVARVLWRLFLSLVLKEAVPCTGIELELFGAQHYLCLT